MREDLIVGDGTPVTSLARNSISAAACLRFAMLSAEDEEDWSAAALERSTHAFQRRKLSFHMVSLKELPGRGAS